jgi:hypothetical protein
VDSGDGRAVKVQTVEGRAAPLQPHHPFPNHLRCCTRDTRSAGRHRRVGALWGVGWPPSCLLAPRG